MTGTPTNCSLQLVQKPGSLRYRGQKCADPCSSFFKNRDSNLSRPIR